MFTDAQVNQMKAACLLSSQEYGNKDAQDILALIERLEAAEKAINHNAFCPALGGGKCDCPVLIWKRSKGDVK